MAFKSTLVDYLASKLKNGKVLLGSLLSYKDDRALAELDSNDLVSKGMLLAFTPSSNGNTKSAEAGTDLTDRVSDGLKVFRLDYAADYHEIGVNPIIWVEIYRQIAADENGNVSILEPVETTIQKFYETGVLTTVDVLLPYGDDGKLIGDYLIRLR